MNDLSERVNTYYKAIYNSMSIYCQTRKLYYRKDDCAMRAI